MSVVLQPFSLERMASSVDKVQERLLRATAALEVAGLAYAVVGGHAVAAWVTRVDEAAVRYTQDVDILLRRTDLPAATKALESAGFVFRHIAGMDVFLDGPDAKVRDAVHLVFAGEKVRLEELLPNPDVTEAVKADRFRIVTLAALVQIKLTAFRVKDRMHLLDMLDVGLIDPSWTGQFPPELAARLQTLIDTPDA